MSENNKVLFIINKYSGTGYRSDVEGKILAACNQLDLECRLEFTKEPGHGTMLAKKAAEQNMKMVFAVGGDGTVNEVAKGLLHTNIPMAIIPKGSGNGLARHLQIPLNITGALKLLSDSKTVRIDTFLVNKEPSFNVAGIGFDGYVAGLFGKDGKRGLVSYGRLVLSEFMRYQEFEFEITIDGKKSVRKSFIVSFANSSQFGNNARIAPSASLLDHLLDITFVKKMSAYQALGFIRRMFNATLDKSKLVDIHKAKRIEITTKVPLPYHIDGEAAGSASRFEIELIPASLLIAVPSKASQL